MLNLLIVDDEDYIVDGLAYDISWQDIGIDNVFTAYNASQALEHLSNYKIDIVITDIRMPSISGLELAQKIKYNWPYTKTIIYSGYNDFDYAKQAIEYNVFSYIMKPESYITIKETVWKAVEELKDQYTKLSKLSNLEKQVVDTVPLIRNSIIKTFLSQGKLNQEAQSHLPFTTEDYGILLVAVPSYKVKDEQKIILMNAAKRILFPNNDILTFKDETNNNVLIFVYSDNPSIIQDIFNNTDRVVEGFFEWIRNYISEDISLLWSSKIQVCELPNTYRELVHTLNCNFFLTKSALIGPKDVITTKKPMYQPEFSYHKLMLLLEQDDLEYIKKQILKYLEKLDAINNTESTLEFYHTLMACLISLSHKRNLSVKKWCGGLFEYLFDISTLHNINDVKDICLKITQAYTSYLHSLKEKNTNRVVHDIKVYIEQNIERPISVKDLSSIFFLNTNYLSRLFKSVEGIPLTEYIINLKINKAKELLALPGMKIYDVSEKLGYESVSHFSKIFKKYTGISPKTYLTK
jgi:two-component system, response regulator YesN